MKAELILIFLLLGGVLALLLHIVIVTLINKTPPMPASVRAMNTISDCIAEFAPTRGGGHVAELGVGWGFQFVVLARKHRQHTFTGYENSFLPWCVATILTKLLAPPHTQIQLKNFLRADLQAFDLLICYLCRPTMDRLKRKLKTKGSFSGILVSNTFALPQKDPISKITLHDIYHTPIYVYTYPK